MDFVAILSVINTLQMFIYSIKFNDDGSDYNAGDVTLHEAVNMAENRALWRLLPMSGATQS